MFISSALQLQLRHITKMTSMLCVSGHFW